MQNALPHAERLLSQQGRRVQDMECVYLLQEIDFDGTPTGLYKIGKTTKGAEQRKRQYQAGNARRVDVYATIKVFDSQAVETELHRQLANYRLNYGGGDEWFDFRAVDINRVVAFMKEYDQSVPEPQPYYSYPKTSYNEFPVTPAVVIGFVTLMGIGGGMTKYVQNGTRCKELLRIP